MTGFIYAIQSGDAVKIGFAKDPVRRLAELNVGSPGAHRLLGYIEGSRPEEKALHRKFHPWHLRGEWFHLNGLVQKFVAGLPRYEPKLVVARGKVRVQRDVLRLKLPSDASHKFPHPANITELGEAYGNALEIEPHTVSFRVFGDSKKLRAITKGADITVSRFCFALHWFSENWPEGVAWPHSIPRPDLWPSPSTPQQATP